jgi:hypothetical protein
MPAKAGIPRNEDWFPAFAGMTEDCRRQGKEPMCQRFFWISFLSVALLHVSGRSADAQRQPLLIATIQSLDGLFGDMNYLAEAVGAAQLGQILTMTTQQYAQGLDGSQPIVVYVDAASGQTANDQWRWLVYLPTRDLSTFLQAAGAQLGTPEPLPGGILRTSGAGTLFLRQDESWTLVADSLEALQSPLMPLDKIIRATDRTADISIRGFAANLPAALRDRALDQLQSKARAELAEIGSGSPVAELRTLLAREKWDQITQLVLDADEFSIGLDADSQKRQVALSVNLTARPHTLTHRRLGHFQSRHSAFAGMLDSSAIATCYAVGQLPSDDAARFEQLLGAVQAAALEELRSSSRFSDESTKQLALSLAKALFEVGRESLHDGLLDGAGMVFFAGSELSAVTGMQVADTRALHDAAATLASRQSAAGISWQGQMNVAEYEHVTLHRFSFVTPRDRALRRAVGPTIEITLGLGPQEVFLAWGKQGVPLIQQTIDAVRRRSPEPVVPFHSRVSLLPLLRFYEQASGDSATTRLLQSAANRPGAGDVAALTATPIRDGVRLEIEVDEIVLRTAGYFALRAAQPQPKSSVKGGSQPTPGEHRPRR